MRSSTFVDSRSPVFFLGSLLRQPDAISQYAEECERMWKALRENSLMAASFEETERFVAKTGIHDPLTIPLEINRGWYVPAKHHPGFFYLFTAFFVNFEKIHDEIIQETSNLFKTDEKNLESKFKQFAGYITIPKHFFCQHGEGLCRERILLAYAQHLSRKQ